MGERGIDPSERLAGDGPEVVVVPGLGLDVRSWDEVRRRLPGGLEVMQLPAFGRTAPRGLDLSPAAQAARLLADPDVAAVDRLVLVGHSASCAVVAEAAVRCRRVVGLVLLAPVDPSGIIWPAVIGRWLRTAVRESPGQARLLVPQYARTGVATMARGMHQVRRHRTDRRLETSGTALTVVRGSEDRISTRWWCGQIAAAGAGRLVTIEGAAHMLPVTSPEQVASTITGVGGP